MKSRIIVDEVAVKKFNMEAKDWYATCPKCGSVLTGTISELLVHRCADGK